MSTAVITADTVRLVSDKNKAGMANYLANKPESLIADIKAAIVWLPRKAAAAIMRAARFLHVPQFAGFVRTNFSRFLAVVGKGAFATEVLTSHWGQKTISTTLKVTAAITRWAIKWSWKILTSPARLFTPTRKGLERFDAGVVKMDRKLTPNSGVTFGPLQLAHDLARDAISPDATHMKLARITAFAVMSLRATRRFVPIGWLRVLTYALDGAIVIHSYNEVLKKTKFGRKMVGKVWAEATVIKSDIDRMGETVIAEATHLNREAATQTAANLRAQAAAVEAEGLAAAEQLKADLVTETAGNAEELRQQASALEETAERLAASEAATAAKAAEQATEKAQEETAIATAVEDKPKPGPSVPPMGGRTPSAGPQQTHQPQGGSKPQKR